jgi:2-phospho-L-lactate guanylyltransferase
MQMRNAPIPWLLLPIKSFQKGKQRLASVLSDRERVQLNEYFFSHMLGIAKTYPGLERTAIVSDADDVIQMANSYGTHIIRCARPGLNEALAEGRLSLVNSGATSMIILPVDLPFACVQDLIEISSLGDRYPVVIAPDKAGTGTNALFLDSKVSLKFQFGSNSFRLHQLESIRCGRQPYLFINERISLDIDEPGDLLLLERSAPSVDCSSSFCPYRRSA